MSPSIRAFKKARQLSEKSRSALSLSSLFSRTGSAERENPPSVRASSPLTLSFQKKPSTM